jgi:guanylate kinase
MKYIITGPAASGKTTFASTLEAKGLKLAKAMTTRPKRGPLDREYNFADNQEAIKKACEIYHVYNGWYYGFTKFQLFALDVFIAGAEMALKLQDYFGADKCLVIFLNAPESLRRMRLKFRDDKADEADQRITRDYKDYAMFSEQERFDVEISNFTLNQPKA